MRWDSMVAKIHKSLPPLGVKDSSKFKKSTIFENLKVLWFRNCLYYKNRSTFDNFIAILVKKCDLFSFPLVVLRPEAFRPESFNKTPF